MKKALLIFMLFQPVLFMAQSDQPPFDTLISSSGDEQVIVVGPSNVKDSISDYAADVVLWFNTCGAELKGLMSEGKLRTGELIIYLKGGLKPNTKEGVNWWIDSVKWIFDAALPIFTAIFTFLLSLFKTNPGQTVNKITELLNKIRTRYLVIGTGVVVTFIGLVFFKEGAWKWYDAFGYLLISVLGSIGLVEILSYFGINIKAKKPA